LTSAEKSLQNVCKRVIIYSRVLQTTAHELNPAREAVSSGPRRHFVKNEKIIYLQKLDGLVE